MQPFQSQNLACAHAQVNARAIAFASTRERLLRSAPVRFTQYPGLATGSIIQGRLSWQIVAVVEPTLEVCDVGQCAEVAWYGLRYSH
jgi:hypothetical protein